MRRSGLSFLFILLLGGMLRADEVGQPPAIGDIPDDSPDTILAKACDEGDLTPVMTLIEQGAPVNGTFGEHQFTPLMVAATKHFDVTLYLISKGAKLDAVDNEGNTALLHACFVDSGDCAQELLESGADPDLANQAGRTPLMNAARNGDEPLVKALLNHHANVNTVTAEGSALWWAVTRDKIEVAKMLIDAGADLVLKYKTPPDPKKPRLSLMGEAARVGDLNLIDLLLDHDMDADARGDDGTTALMIAAERPKTDVLEVLLQKGANANLQNQAGETALMRAAKHDRPQAIDLLHQVQARLDTTDLDGKTALIWAAMTRSSRAARALVDDGADFDIADRQGETALTWAGDCGLVEIVDLLRQRGAHRTDVHIIPKGDPPQPLPPARAWAMSVAAIYFQRTGLNPKILGGNLDPVNEQNVLKREWNVTDKTTLEARLDDLRDHGDRATDQTDGLRMGIMSTDQFNQLLLATMAQAGHLKAARVSYFKWKERSGLAWDLCRAANLVNVGFAAGYIDANEAWDRLLAFARQTKAGFSSWKEMSDNFLDGREIWAGKRDPHFDACAQLLLNDQDHNSPWTQNPWKTDLPPPPKPAN